MSSQFQPHYDSFPSNSLHPTSTSTPAAFLTRARATVMATRRPWSQLIDRHSFSRPDPFFGVATFRIKRNLYYFRVNYAMIVLVILFLSLLWHPISMIVFLIVFVAWFLLYFFRDQPFVILNRQVDDRFILGILGIITILSLIFTNVWLNVLVSVLIGAFVVVLHAAFRETEDLYNDEGDGGDNGMFSVVGSPPSRGGYTSV
ncbi:hypothetical protein LWI29_033498 [Acer saccharum]|uniref:PRA1 family protein n=1 Tax=Acer saccharum TaxID=4024 RepID=A0AA39RX48_ACESA|nr:hypothetical protein LWI29_033498 [Acer saccharum]KAK1560175.1 hypothetical protein Q3G72_023220 [Acer saccharum]